MQTLLKNAPVFKLLSLTIRVGTYFMKQGNYITEGMHLMILTKHNLDDGEGRLDKWRSGNWDNG